MSAPAKAADKFIAFFDVLGWKSFVNDVEKRGNDRSVESAVELLKGMREAADPEYSIVCPHSDRIAEDLAFCSSFAPDSAVLSAEASPRGLITLLCACKAAYQRLILRQGLMCRGYVKRGRLYHTSDYCVGSGLGEVITAEKKIRFFKTETGDTGTPFIELDPNITKYIAEHQEDRCVAEVFESITIRDEQGGYAIHPIPLPLRTLGTTDLAYTRSWIEKTRRMVASLVDQRNKRALAKQRAFEHVLNELAFHCDKKEEALREPFPPGRFTPESFPGLFRKR